MRIMLCLMTLMSSSLLAQDVKLPKEIKASVGQPVTINAETDGEIVRWYVVDPGLFMFDPNLQTTTKAAQVWAIKAGRYRVIAWSAKDNVPGEGSEVLVIVGNPPDPGPGPGPNPPDPPEPPDLTGLAKNVYDWAKAVGNEAEAKTIAENYAAINSAIGAGAYNNEPNWINQRGKVIGDLYVKNHEITEKNRQWNDFFKKLSDEMKKLDEAGKVSNLNQLHEVLKEIQKGLEAI